MKKEKRYALVSIALMASLFVLVTSSAQSAERNKGQGEQTASAGVEISTDELKEILAAGKIPVIDVRPEKEYAVSHIPYSFAFFG